MKKALLITLIAGVTALMAQPRYTDIYTAAQQARQQNKVIYFVVLSETCPHCQQYWRSLNDPEIEGLLNSEVIFAVTNIERGDKIPGDLPLTGQAPTTYLLKGDGNLINQPITGAIPKNQIRDLLLKIGKVQRWN